MARRSWARAPSSLSSARSAPMSSTSGWTTTGGKPRRYQELEFRWVPEGVTRLATLLTGEVHIADIDRALHKDARPRA